MIDLAVVGTVVSVLALGVILKSGIAALNLNIPLGVSLICLALHSLSLESILSLWAPGESTVAGIEMRWLFRSLFLLLMAIAISKIIKIEYLPGCEETRRIWVVLALVGAVLS